MSPLNARLQHFHFLKHMVQPDLDTVYVHKSSRLEIIMAFWED